MGVGHTVTLCTSLSRLLGPSNCSNRVFKPVFRGTMQPKDFSGSESLTEAVNVLINTTTEKEPARGGVGGAH